MIFPNQNVPRWIIFLMDTILVLMSLILSCLLRFEFKIPNAEIGPFIFAFPIYMMVRIASFLYGKTYAGIVRNTNIENAVRVFKTILIGSAVITIFNPIKYFLWDSAYFMSFSIIIIDAIIASGLLILFRIAIKALFSLNKSVKH